MLLTVNLAFGAVKAVFEFLSTPEGQELCREARTNRAELAAWFASMEKRLPELLARPEQNPVLAGVRKLFSN